MTDSLSWLIFLGAFGILIHAVFWRSHGLEQRWSTAKDLIERFFAGAGLGILCLYGATMWTSAWLVWAGVLTGTAMMALWYTPWAQRGRIPIISP